MTDHPFDERNSDFYDLEYFISMEYRYFSGAHGSRVRNVMAAVGDVRGQRVLDVGCGGGYFTNQLAERGAEVIGIDYARFGVQFGKNRYPGLDLRVHSALELHTFPESGFDVVTIFDAIEHISDQETLMRGIHHVLKPGGRVVISTDADDSAWMQPRFGRIMHAFEHLSAEGRAYRVIKHAEAPRRRHKSYHSSHIANVTTRQLQDLLRAHGFTVMAQRVYPIVGVPIRDAVLRLLPPLYRGDHQCVVARRD